MAGEAAGTGCRACRLCQQLRTWVVLGLALSRVGEAGITCDQIAARTVPPGCALEETSGYLQIKLDGTLPADGHAGESDAAGARSVYWVEYWHTSVDPSKAVPILAVHGGPGGSHDYLLSLKYLACHTSPSGSRYRVIFYDQMGQGRSARSPQGVEQAGPLSIGYYTSELQAVVQGVVLRKNNGPFHLLGHSFGGTLALSYATRFPDFIQAKMSSLILSSPYGPSARFAADSVAKKIQEQLPPLYTAILLSNNDGDPAYPDAVRTCYDLLYSRLLPHPDCVRDTYEHINKDIQTGIVGVADWRLSGSLASFDATPQLPQILVPTFAFVGEFDLMSTGTLDQLRRIPYIHTDTIPKAAHLTHIDNFEGVYVRLGKWLDDTDSLPYFAVNASLRRRPPTEEASRGKHVEAAIGASAILSLLSVLVLVVRRRRARQKTPYQSIGS